MAVDSNRTKAYQNRVREIEQKLAGMDYAYDSARNQFV